jgi:hypothetical protein
MQLRITKYHPKYRDTNGFYRKNEWISVDQIGDKFDGELFTAIEYLKTEDNYVKTILLLLDRIKLENLEVDFISRKGIIPSFFSTYEYFYVEKKFASKIKSGYVCSRREIEILIRANLRNDFDCFFKGDHGTYLHLSWDYYMFFGSEKSVDLKTIDIPEGIYIDEAFPSPCWPDPELYESL